MQKHYLNGLFATVLVLLSQFFVSSSYAVPVYYSLHGTASAYTFFIDEFGPETSFSPTSSISGTMVIDSVPSGYSVSNDTSPWASHQGSLEWIVKSFTISSPYFNFNGNGSLRLMGDDYGLEDINEHSITGHAITPYFNGTMNANTDIGGGPNYFYHADGTPYEENFPAYSAGLPDMISPKYPGQNLGWEFSQSLGWEFSNNHAEIGNFTAIRETGTPVPEPSTILLLGIGIIGIALIGRNKNG